MNGLIDLQTGTADAPSKRDKLLAEKCGSVYENPKSCIHVRDRFPRPSGTLKRRSRVSLCLNPATLSDQAACTSVRNRRTSLCRLSASIASASASALTSAAVERAPVEAPATRLMDWAPVRASTE